MITTFILNLFGLILTLIMLPLTLVSELSFRIVDPYYVQMQIQDAIHWVIAPLNYFRGVAPIEDVLMALSYLTVFYMWVYIVRFIFWIASMLPGMSQVTLPFFTQQAIGEYKTAQRNKVTVELLKASLNKRWPGVSSRAADVGRNALTPSGQKRLFR